MTTVRYPSRSRRRGAACAPPPWPVAPCARRDAPGRAARSPLRRRAPVASAGLEFAWLFGQAAKQAHVPCDLGFVFGRVQTAPQVVQPRPGQEPPEPRVAGRALPEAGTSARVAQPGPRPRGYPAAADAAPVDLSGRPVEGAPPDTLTGSSGETSPDCHQPSRA